MKRCFKCKNLIDNFSEFLLRQLTLGKDSLYKCNKCCCEFKERKLTFYISKVLVFSMVLFWGKPLSDSLLPKELTGYLLILVYILFGAGLIILLEFVHWKYASYVQVN